MSGPVVRDEMGLHAVECECLECEAGFRPSPMQRYYAAEVFKRRKLADEALQKKPSREELRRIERRRLAAEEAERRQVQEQEWRRAHPPLTRQQIQELEETKRRMFPALARSAKR